MIILTFPLHMNGVPTGDFFLKCSGRIISIHKCGNCYNCTDIASDDNGSLYVFCQDDYIVQNSGRNK
jgi:hypothetical protein